MNAQMTTARATGSWYLGLAVTGVLGFLLVRPMLYVVGDPAATLDNLTTRQGLARLGIVLEMGIVVTQALAAVWFYKLYRSVRPTAGVAVAAFGLVNAVAIMCQRYVSGRRGRDREQHARWSARPTRRRP